MKNIIKKFKVSKKQIKNQKGISLVSLSITIVLLLIISNIVISNTSEKLKFEGIENMQSDIANLRGKISNFYAENGTLPVDKTSVYSIMGIDGNVTNGVNISGIDAISMSSDFGNFYVIDLSAIDNLTLNYGEDFELYKNKSYGSLGELTDIYIINERSHNIFYVEGIEISEKIYYTDYSALTKEKATVDIRYIDGYKLPENYMYISGDSKEGIYLYEKGNLSNISKGELDQNNNWNITSSSISEIKY